MENIKNVLAVIIALISCVMICVNWPNGDATAWMVALVGWLEVINYQRNK
jgi:hypothetical protein